jgi:hypothetical protein
MLDQWKFDRGFRSLLSSFTESERLIRDLRGDSPDPVRIQCAVYRVRHRIHCGIAVLSQTSLRSNQLAWRHVREGAKEADECLAYALESLEYDELESASTDLERALNGLHEALFAIRTRSSLRFRSWPLDPFRWVARRVASSRETVSV